MSLEGVLEFQRFVSGFVDSFLPSLPFHYWSLIFGVLGVDMSPVLHENDCMVFFFISDE